MKDFYSGNFFFMYYNKNETRDRMIDKEIVPTFVKIKNIYNLLFFKA